MSETAREVTDGLGCTRVCGEMGLSGQAVNVRAADPGDCMRLLAWRNDPIARSNSFSQDEVRPEEHMAWLERALVDPAQSILIGELDGAPIGGPCPSWL